MFEVAAEQEERDYRRQEVCVPCSPAWLLSYAGEGQEGGVQVGAQWASVLAVRDSEIWPNSKWPGETVYPGHVVSTERGQSILELTIPWLTSG